jgi:hypothetical protein
MGAMQRLPVGVVEQDGDGYVGRCDEVGVTSVGRTVAEAFANLRTATWRQIERQGGDEGRLEESLTE